METTQRRFGPKPKPKIARTMAQGFSVRPYHLHVLDEMCKRDGLWGRSEALASLIEREGVGMGLTREDFEKEIE